MSSYLNNYPSYFYKSLPWFIMLRNRRIKFVFSLDAGVEVNITELQDMVSKLVRGCVFSSWRLSCY